MPGAATGFVLNVGPGIFLVARSVFFSVFFIAGRGGAAIAENPSGLFAKDFAGKLAGDFARTFAGDFAGDFPWGFARKFARKFAGDFARDFAGDFAGNVVAAVVTGADLLSHIRGVVACRPDWAAATMDGARPSTFGAWIFLAPR
jgi:hypothetical protein